MLGNFNKCQALEDDTSSQMYVCDVTTGDTGFNVFADQTCTELDKEIGFISFVYFAPRGMRRKNGVWFDHGMYR